MRRLLRRAGPDSDTRSERGSEPERGAARRSQRMRMLACATLLATAALVAPAAGAEPLREDELPNWIPSFGVGFGIQTRDVRGRIDNPNKPGLGVVISEINNSSIPPFFKPILIEQARANPLYGGAFLPTGVPIKEPMYECRSPVNPPTQFTGWCFFYDDATEAVDGSTVPLGGQLIGPPEPFLGRIRPFVHGAFAIDFDSRVIASSGLKPGGFPASGSLPRLRVQLEARPASTWWAGGGLAVQLPIDRPLFLKLGYNYSEHNMDLEGSIWRGITVNNEDVILRNNAYDDLKITSWGPSFGLEAEVWRIGSLAMNLSADLLVFFPRSGTSTRFTVQSPRATTPPADPPYCGGTNDPSNCIQPAFLTVDADETQYHGSLSLRLTWLGIPF